MIPWQLFFLAIANRMRDGWITEIFKSGTIYNFFTKNSQMGRLLLWALPFSVTLIIGHGFPDPWYMNWFYFLLLCLAAFGGACCANWGTVDHPVMGKTSFVWTFKNLLQLAWWGVVFTGIPGILVCAANYPNNLIYGGGVILSGLTIVPAYWLGWKIPGKWNGTLYGSLIFGSFIGLSIYLLEVIK